MRIVVRTRKEFFIRGAKTHGQIICAQCGGTMISEQIMANFFGISRRAIYRFVESERIDFVEFENDLYVCPVSLKKTVEETLR